MKLLCMDASSPADAIAGIDRLNAALSAALGREIDPSPGFAGIVCALSGGRYSRDYDDLLEAINFNKLARNTALVATAAPRSIRAAMQPGRPMYCIVKPCAALKIPVAMVVNQIGDGAAELYSITNAGIMTIGLFRR